MIINESINTIEFSGVIGSEDHCCLPPLLLVTYPTRAALVSDKPLNSTRHPAPITSTNSNKFIFAWSWRWVVIIDRCGASWLQYLAGGSIGCCLLHHRQLPPKNATGGTILQWPWHCGVRASSVLPLTSKTTTTTFNSKWSKMWELGTYPLYYFPFHRSIRLA